MTEEGLRFVQLIERLKSNGQLPNYVVLANMLGTNKVGISDIRAGRKNISIDLLRRLVNSYPEVSIEWVVMGQGDMLKPKADTASVMMTARDSPGANQVAGGGMVVQEAADPENLRALIAEKDARIADLKETIEILRSRK